ncbi:helicase-related protein [Treponema saccharophilum]|uniref:RNA helicase n=2 Tax=Treponema TaxID=157 RepID=H7EI46_9SPIR|nr:ATP-dependent RNA helicase [Treponema saccharophilum]EIC02725.1 helicase domain protein [Treponema saccharophilum DSM 2985]BDC96121.1 ATP-dependent helicase HrpA [Treponema saccharophilum]
MDYQKLPVYEQKDKILESLRNNQVVIVQSPTGSGKTTQIPVILHEAGYSKNGMIAVTQPRRIAALSVSEFISKQLGTTYPGLVGYKMRFDDKTDASTRIKIMTDGILLQEMKLDPWLSGYSVMMVDEAHERSLNIDFVLGLLKRVLKARPEFKVVVSSATMNAEAFSKYFDDAPIVTIETQTFPVTMIYDPPEGRTTTATATGSELLLAKIETTIERVIDNGDKGDILIFLPGEKIIKDCAQRLAVSSVRHKLHIVPLYGRLPKEEQERVFDKPPLGKRKVVISTNIAETSVTINGITTVIDSGLAKLNFYSPRTYTSSLIETPVSRASCNQRRGRAGRTQPGTCYRLYPRDDFESRDEFTTEEIFRTDLSEVVLRMSELGITDFSSFDFISRPGDEGIRGAVETLNLLGALESDNTLSKIGKMMVEFPLEPRISRIIVESIMRYPEVLEEVLIAAAFMSTHSPFILPPGEEMEARRAHHAFRDMQGDFVSYVKLFRTYISMKNQQRFCQNNYLDEKVMAEILNIKTQLEEEVAAMGIPITGGGSMDDYLCCIASGMIQFVCIREGKENYRSLTADHISIHPGSSMFKTDPLFIVAGEIVRTSRTFASSVSPLTKALINKISPDLEERLNAARGKKGKSLTGGLEFNGTSFNDIRGKKVGKDDGRFGGKESPDKKKDENSVTFGGITFKIAKEKGKKILAMPIEQLKVALGRENDKNKLAQIAGLRGRLKIGRFELLGGEKAEVIFKVVRTLNLDPLPHDKFPKNVNIDINEEGGKDKLVEMLPFVLRITEGKKRKGGKAGSAQEYSFITLHSDGKGTFWFKLSRGFPTAINESLSSLESLVDADIPFSEKQKEIVNGTYRMINSMYE